MSALLAHITNMILLGLTGIITLVVAAGLSAFIMAQILIADFMLILAAIFFPIGVALWPISRSWALSCFSAMLQAGFTGVAYAFFVDIVFSPGGPLDVVVRQALAMYPDAAPWGQVEIVLTAALAVIAFMFLIILIAIQIPRIVGQLITRLDFQIVGK